MPLDRRRRAKRRNPTRPVKAKIPPLRTLLRRIRDVVERNAVEPSMVESFDEGEVEAFVEYCLAAWRTLAFDATVQQRMTAAWQDNYVSLQWRENSVHVVSLFGEIARPGLNLVIKTWRVTVDTSSFTETLGHYYSEEEAEAAGEEWYALNTEPGEDADIGYEVEEITDEDYRVHSPASVHFLYAHPHDDVNTPHSNAWKADELRATGLWEPREYQWVYTEPPPWPVDDDLPTLNPSATATLAALADDASSDSFAFEEFYGHSGEEMLENEPEDAIRYGRKVTWVGIPGQMIEIDPNYVVPMEGNIFDERKLAAVAEAMRGGEKPVLGVGFGTVQIIDANTVAEHNASMERGEILATDRPFDERDIGKLLYTIRDGNHRTFGALIGGERKVWINLYANTFQLVKQWRAMLDGVTSKKKRAEIIRDFFMGAERWPQSYVDLVEILDRKLRED